MRVAVTFPGVHRRGGVERVALECVQFLAARGHDVSLLATEWDDGLVDGSVRRHQVTARRKPPALALLGFAVASRRALKGLRPPPQVLSSFGVQSPPGGVLWIQSVHRAWLEISSRHRGFGGRLRQRLNPFHPVALALERHVIGGRRYRKLIALTPQVKSDLSRLYGVPDGDVVVIPNGFARAEFNPARAATLRPDARRRWGYTDEDRVVAFVANELERKGFAPLLRAVAALGNPVVKVLVAGRVTPGRYAAEIDQLQMLNRVQFIGPADDVAAVYAAADLFALPTEYEAWGLVIVEALACGLPVVTSRLAGAAVAVDHGRTGFLLEDPRDVGEISASLAAVLRGTLTTPDQIAASVSDYAWDTVLLQYERVLLDCISGGA